ncbi:MAG: hypothetical protein HOW73_43210 [Polyangiaceae bacterium]|nr:hypothetical protein [Polyangiaceae bacterium]
MLEHFDAAIAEVDACLDVLGLDVAIAKADADEGILTRNGFDRVVAFLAALLLRKTRPIEAAAQRKMEAALDRDWKRMSDTRRAEAIGKATGIMLATAAEQARIAAKVISIEGRGIISATKRAARDTYGLSNTDIFNAVDQRVIDQIRNSQAHYVRDEFGRRRERQSAMAREIVAQGELRGASSQEMAKELAIKMRAAGVARNEAYWRMVANVFTARARTYGALASFEHAGIGRARWASVMDEVTSVFCRLMHGRVFEVKHALERFAAVAAAPNPEAVVDLQPWMRRGKDDDGNEVIFVQNSAGMRTRVATVVENAVGRRDEPGRFKGVATEATMAKLGISCPPAHPNCRSTIVPA